MSWLRRVRGRVGTHANGRGCAHIAVLHQAGWPIFVFVAVAYLIIIALHLAWPHNFGDVLFGAMLMTPPWVISLAIATDPSASAWARGADAEEWTDREVRRGLQPRYLLVNDVQLGHSNADHVIVGPAGVIVLETKWSSKPWATARGWGEIRRATGQAKHTARTVARLLSEHAIAVAPTPVVVLWGGNIRTWTKGTGVRTVDGVVAVAGTELAAWVAQLPAHDAGDLDAGAIVDALRAGRAH